MTCTTGRAGGHPDAFNSTRDALTGGERLSTSLPSVHDSSRNRESESDRALFLPNESEAMSFLSDAAHVINLAVSHSRAFQSLVNNGLGPQRAEKQQGSARGSDVFRVADFIATPSRCWKTCEQRLNTP